MTTLPVVTKVTAAALARAWQGQVVTPIPCLPSLCGGSTGGGGVLDGPSPGSRAHIRESCRRLEPLLPTMGIWALSGCSGWTSSPSSGEGGRVGA